MISVIIPVYNAEKWINKCLDSLINQTMFQDMELIIIDDGSVDNCGKVIDEYALKYQNIRCKHIQNGGVSNARNTGLDMCNGEFVTFVDADDYFDDCFIENLFNAMDDGCDITCSGFIAEYPTKNVVSCPIEARCLDKNKTIYEFLIADQLEPNVTDKLFRTNLIGNKRFDATIAIAEDKYFLFQCLKEVRKIKLIPVANYHYVMNDDSACRNGFAEKKFHSIKVADLICDDIKEYYPEYYGLAKSMAIDVRCRICGDIFYNQSQEVFSKEYKKIYAEIRSYSIAKKAKYSSKKHLLAFIAAKIHPGLYCFLKNDMKLQYKR